MLAEIIPHNRRRVSDSLKLWLCEGALSNRTFEVVESCFKVPDLTVVPVDIGD